MQDFQRDSRTTSQTFSKPQKFWFYVCYADIFRIHFQKV